VAKPFDILDRPRSVGLAAHAWQGIALATRLRCLISSVGNSLFRLCIRGRRVERHAIESRRALVSLGAVAAGADSDGANGGGLEVSA
jgi:hypothetical protein